MSTAMRLPDAEAREAAVTACDRDVVVEAGAGSGKTSLLVERMLHALLSEGAALGRVAAITFTKKAAAEMVERLGKELALFQAGVEAGTPPAERDAAGRVWRRCATPEARQEAGDRAAEVLQTLDEAIVTTVHAFCGGLLRRHPLASGLPPRFQEDDGTALRRLLKSYGPQAVARALEGMPPASRTRLAERFGAEQILKAAGVAAGQPPAPADADSEDPFELLAAAAAAAAGLLREELERQGWLGHSEVILRTRDLLRKCPAVRREERRRWQHLLVDELQDTDPLQYSILESLSLEPDEDGPRPRLFLVGDPKQSIYRFRGADLSAYEGFMDRVAARGLRLALDTNFRSRAPLLEPLNLLFGEAMQAVDRVQPPYRAMQAAQDGTGGGRPGASVRLVTVPAEGRAEDLRKAESAVIAEEILAFRKAGCAWEDVLVLLPKFTGLPVLQRCLQAHGIPFSVAGGKTFYKRQEVADYAALLTACIAGPEERGNAEAAILALLRCSVGAVRDAEILRYRQGIGRAAVFGSPPPASADCPGVRRLLERLQAWREELGHLPEDARPERALDLSGLRDHYALRPAGSQAVANLDKAAEHVAEEVRRYGVPLAEAVETLAGQLGQGEDSDQPVSEENAEAVSILTVHKAKGLERRFVIVGAMEGGLDREPRGFQLWAEEDRGYGIQIRKDETNTLFQELAADDRRHRAAERLRLLYVALTRAREGLVLVQSRTGPGEAQRNVWLQALAAGWGYQVDEGAGPSGRHAPAGVVFERRLPAVPAGVTAATPAPDLGMIADAVEEMESSRPAARPRFATPSGLHGDAVPVPDTAGRSGGELGRAAGTLVHRLLERWDLAALEGLAAGLDSALPAVLRDHPGLSRAALRARVEEILARLPGTPCGEALLALRGQELCREVPMLLAEGDLTWSGAIDLLYRPHGGAWTVADFKTDRGLAPDAAREQYGGQLEIYGRAVRAALGLQQPPSLELWLLDSGQVVSVGQA